MNFKYVLNAVFVLLLLGCSKEPQRTELHISGATMGTRYNIKFPENEDIDVDIFKADVTKRLFEINKLMSTYDPESELSRLNQYRYTKPFPISEETALVLQEAIRLGELSDGVLDVTVGPLVNLWGFGPTKRPETIPTDEAVEQIRKYVGLDKFTLSGNSVTKLHPLLYIDLSTIAKGYAVDELARLLEQANVTNYLVEIGGEMRVSGKKSSGKAWSIAVEKPITQARAVQRIISIGNNAIATSGDYRNYYEEDGVRYSHLINPKTGKPIQHNTVSVAVVHPSSMVADGLATAFNVMGVEKALALANENDIAALVIVKNGDKFEELTSSTFDDVVETY